MARPKLKITGDTDKIYDLDVIEEGARDNAGKELLVQVHEFNPVTGLPNPGRPEDLKVGQVWLSIRK